MLGYILSNGMFGILTGQMCASACLFDALQNLIIQYFSFVPCYILRGPSSSATIRCDQLPVLHKFVPHRIFVVWLVYVLEAIFTMCTAISAWVTYGAHWGDVDVLKKLHWSWDVLPPTSSLSE